MAQKIGAKYVMDPEQDLIGAPEGYQQKAMIAHLKADAGAAAILGGRIMDGPPDGTPLPHLGSGISWMRDGRRVMAVPHLAEGRISVIDMEDWSLLKVIETSGPGFFLRTAPRKKHKHKHEQTQNSTHIKI